MNDLDVKRAIDAAGNTISPSFRNELRSQLKAELAGDVPTTSPTATDRASVLRTRLVIGLGLVGAAAAIAVVVLIANNDDQRDVLVPATDVPVVSTTAPVDTTPVTAPVTTPATTVPDASALIARLGNDRWVLDSIGSEPFAGGLVPYLAFGGEAFVTGFDGCNWYGLRGSLEGDIVRSSVLDSTSAGCDGLFGGLTPVDGDRLVMSTDGLSFDLVHGDGSVRLSYTRRDHLGSVPVGNAERGSWHLGESAPFAVEFSDVGTLTYGTCAFMYSIGARLTVDVDMQDPYSCLNGSTDQTSSRLIESLVDGPVDIMISDDGSTMYLTNDEFVLRLVEAGPVLDPAGITLSAGAVFGVTAGSEVRVDEVLAAAESAYRPVDTDTGWYDVPLVSFEDGTQDCLTGGTHRVLWWGDLSMAFWQFDDGTEMLWAWSIGDKRVSHWGDRREPYTPVGPVPTGFTVEGGIGIGSPATQIVDVFGDRVGHGYANQDGTVSYDSVGRVGWEFTTGMSVAFLAEDDVVTGIGAQLMFC